LFYCWKYDSYSPISLLAHQHLWQFLQFIRADLVRADIRRDICYRIFIFTHMGTNWRQVWQEKNPDYVSARAWNILAPDGLCHVCLGIILPEVVYGNLYRFHPDVTSINRYPDT